MSGLYENNILPSNPTWIPGTGSYTNKELERWYGHSRCWPNCLESHKWVVERMTELLKENPDYKSEYFGQEEIDRIRKKLCI